jgi:maltooligosyltrehalose trehalohydrolase
MRRLLAGDDEGYYADYRGTTADIATELERGWLFTGQTSQFWDGPRGTDPEGITPPHFCFCIQNHDQVGNRAFGDRLHQDDDVSLEAYRAASTLLLVAAQTPMLFMGQEWAASTPFLFFSDHDEDLGRRVTEGRRDEFKAWSAFNDEAARDRIPDPQALETFERSRLDWSEREREPHASALRLYQALLRLRRSEPLLRWSEGDTQRATALDDDTIELHRERGDDAIVLVARLRGEGEVEVQPPEALEAGTWRVLLTTEDEGFASDAVAIATDYEEGSLRLRFARPGAVLLRAAST